MSDKGPKIDLPLTGEQVKILDQVLRSMWRGADPGPVVRRPAFKELAQDVHQLVPAEKKLAPVLPRRSARA